MLKNYLKIIQRTIIRKGFYSLSKILGLTIGLATTFLIAFYVQYELEFDKYHKNSDRIFRVGYHIKSLETDEVERQAWVSALAGPQLVEDFPEIESFTRVKQTGGLFFIENNPFEAEGLFFADGSFFDVFTHEFVKGDAQTALVDPYSIVFTETQATSYFGNSWKRKPLENLAVKLVLRDTMEFRVTGIIKDVPNQSHFSFNGLISHKTREILYDHINGWFSLGTHTYILTQPNLSETVLESKIESMVMKYYGDEAQKLGYELQLFTQPLTDIHLHSSLLKEIEPNGSIDEIIVISIAGLLIFLIACINYINLSTVGDMHFSRQIGVRKVVGSSQGEIIQLFLMNSAVFVLIAIVLALCFVEMSLSNFNAFFDTYITSLLDRGAYFWLVCLSVFLLITLTGGGYTAFVLSAQKPVNALKGAAKTESGASLRKGLIIFQFTASIILICGTFVIKQQVDFMINKPMGFDKENVVVIDAWMNRELRENPDLIKKEFNNLPHVSAVSYSNSVPGQGLLQRTARPEGTDQWIVMETLITDAEFMSLYNIELAAGRPFKPQSSADLESAFIINASAAKLFGWSAEESIDKKIEWGSSKQGRIIGVAKDFHYQSVQEKIEPLVVHLSETGGLISIKISETSAIENIEKAYKHLYPDHVFKFSFLNENMQAKYDRFLTLGKVVSFFASIAIVITCIGLISLIAYTTNQRSKEIAVRKVLGATAGQVVVLLAKNFTSMVLIASVLAIPVIYYMVQWWLSNFAYRITPGVEIYVISALSLTIICWLTISFQSLKAAFVNPVNMLKEE